MDARNTPCSSSRKQFSFNGNHSPPQTRSVLFVSLNLQSSTGRFAKSHFAQLWHNQRDKSIFKWKRVSMTQFFTIWLQNAQTAGIGMIKQQQIQYAQKGQKQVLTFVCGTFCRPQNINALINKTKGNSYRVIGCLHFPQFIPSQTNSGSLFEQNKARKLSNLFKDTFLVWLLSRSNTRS